MQGPTLASTSAAATGRRYHEYPLRPSYWSIIIMRPSDWSSYREISVPRTRTSSQCGWALVSSAAACLAEIPFDKEQWRSPSWIVKSIGRNSEDWLLFGRHDKVKFWKTGWSPTTISRQNRRWWAVGGLWRVVCLRASYWLFCVIISPSDWSRMIMWPEYWPLIGC